MPMLTVRVAPRASRDEIVGPDLDAEGRLLLQLRVRAVPEDGKANAAVEALLAKVLGVAKRQVVVVAGGKSRIKRVELADLSESAAARLKELLGHGG
ncbi:MAG: DUF167 domain-containing protein [Hyphomonadaceae bacterium]|nr:DUF167 domain-containing protein [Hyphomonadaceae bacterium]